MHPSENPGYAIFQVTCGNDCERWREQQQDNRRAMVKVKVNVDLYSASSWSHLYDAQVWNAFFRDLTVLPAHPAFIR